MKKITAFTVCLILMLCAAVNINAAESCNILYGDKTLAANKIEDFSDSVISDSPYGEVYIDEGLEMFSQNIVDRYNITTPKAAVCTELFKAAKYIAISLHSLGDGEVYFCFQPSINGEDNLFMYGVSDEPIRLVDRKGKSEDAVFTDTASVNNRFAITIPTSFDGFVIIPLEDIAFHGSWSTAWVQGESVIKGAGFHASYIDGLSSFVEMTIDGLYLLDSLEGSASPVSTAAPATTEQTVVTNALTEENQQTIAPQTESGEAPEANSNTALYIIIGIVAVVIVAVVVILIIKKKK